MSSCADPGYCIPLSEQLAASPCSAAHGGSECDFSQLCFAPQGGRHNPISMNTRTFFRRPEPSSRDVLSIDDPYGPVVRYASS